MRFVIVTGMSGAGKSSVLNMLEDSGYFCVDNLPVPLLQEFVHMSWHENDQASDVAVGIDIRSSKHLNMLGVVLDAISAQGYTYEILFLECRTDTLVRRFKETRRRHPLGKGGRIEDAIADERSQLKFLKSRSDFIIDTSTLLIRDLTQEIKKIFSDDQRFDNFYVTLLSFGFKYGIPTDADLVFDVRFLPNPYYVEELKYMTGNEKPVRDYVMHDGEADIFLDKLYELLTFLIPRYIKEGKNELVVAIGCTGGRHRSVTLTNELFLRMKDLKYGLKADHRDIDRDQAKNRN